MILRKRFRIQGVVQGVGFRPFVHQLATRLGIGGHVLNSSAGVVIEAEGAELERFEQGLPPLARVDAIEAVGIETCGDERFVILDSVDGRWRGRVAVGEHGRRRVPASAA